MKFAKIYTVLAAAAAMLGVASCSTPDTPVMQKPTEFKLNVPPFAQQYYDLTEGGVLEFTCSQPDYGIGTVVNYSAEISLTEDFAEYKTLANINGASATIGLNEADVAIAICEMLGITDEDTWQPYAEDHVRPLYVRAVAQVGSYEWTNITSNVIELPRVDFYYALKTPAYIYLVGAPSGWTEPIADNADKYKDWRLWEADDAVGSNVYSAVFDMPADPVFRFATALTGWDSDFIGIAGGPNDDKEVDCILADGEYNGTLAVTKDKLEFKDFTGGKMTITVDLNKMTVKVQAGEQEVVTPKYVYMVGNQAMWKEPSADNAEIYDNWRLECTDGSGVFTGTFEITETQDNNPDLFCRFYQELTGWGAAQWASVTGKDYPVTPGVAAETAVGEGPFQLEGALGATISVSLDTKANTVTFDFVD